MCAARAAPRRRPLQVANLGDSGVRVIRDGRVVFASAAQQHMFNMPYQLSHPSIIDSPDDADSADVTTVDVVVSARRCEHSLFRSSCCGLASWATRQGRRAEGRDPLPWGLGCGKQLDLAPFWLSTCTLARVPPLFLSLCSRAT